MRNGKYIIHIDMDDTMCDFTGAQKEAIEKVPGIKYPQSQMDFFRKLKPIEGAISAYQNLSNKPQFEVHILTAPSIDNPLCYTEKRLWVADHLGMDAVKNMIIAGDKSLVFGDFLIDDHIDGRGQDRFVGTVLQFGSIKFPNWESILDYIYAIV